MQSGTPPPRRVRFADDERTTLVVEWREGHESAYPLDYLRGWCTCAECQGHAGTHRFVASPAPRTLTAITAVGAYAIQLAWDDGHATGIYPFDALRSWCPCAECGGAREGTPDDVAQRASAVNAKA